MDAPTLTQLIKTRDAATERAIVVLYNRQTDDERGCGDTRHRNGAGFNSADARFLTSLANQIERQHRSHMSGRRLSPRQLGAARRLLPKYVGQLLASNTPWDEFASGAASNRQCGEELRSMEDLAASLLENTKEAAT